MFISKHYAEKDWPTHERRSAFEKAIESKEEYILPARFDDTEIPGLHKTIAYVDLRRKSFEQLAALILQKLGRPHFKRAVPHRNLRLLTAMANTGPFADSSEIRAKKRSVPGNIL